MSIMDLFKPQQKPAESTQPQQNTPPQAKQNLSDNPPSTDASGKMPGTEPANQNPLDEYRKIFDNANNGSEIVAPDFSLDPKVLRDVSSKMDFTRGINQEVVQKATSGDVSALMDIIKQVGQNAYRASIEHNTALTDSFIKQRGEFEKKNLEQGVRQHLTQSELSNTPNYQHPVIKAELNRVASQFAAANPDASPQEVAQAAKKYLDDLHAALNPQSGKKGEENTGEMDWSKYITG